MQILSKRWEDALPAANGVSRYSCTVTADTHK